MNNELNNMMGSVGDYVTQKNLKYTKEAIEYVEKSLVKCGGGDLKDKRCENALVHIFEVSQIIIDLELPITADEEDALLAAVMLHVLPENWPMEDLHSKIVDSLGYPEETFRIVDMLSANGDMTADEQQELCERIQSDKLALIAALADRGNVIQRVYERTTWASHRYISETKAYYMPMAIYGKEHYRELVGIISILMEKLRTLVEVAEIFLKRFEINETELSQDILALREENATIRGIIADFRRD